MKSHKDEFNKCFVFGVWYEIKEGASVFEALNTKHQILNTLFNQIGNEKKKIHTAFCL